MRLIFIGLILAQTACSRPVTHMAELTPRSLKAINLEETVSRRDELMMAYSMTSYDDQHKAVGVVNGGWGVESVQKGQFANVRTAQPINLPLPRNGRIVASLVLIEVDDYNRANSMMEQVRRVHNIVAGPAALLLTATEVLTPLKYVSAGLAASGIGLKLVDQLDDDDLLGQSSVEIDEADLRRKKQRLVRVPAVFTGRNLRDNFEYRLEYDITLKTVNIGTTRQ
ncbi:hypothetical protein [Spirosoma utsteinense]|uniref:Uncharacterized protein n=1 Tax=Spirosoma utsteinense TaxID=2585773 RepID=A0ABR6W3I9_9BACT|nr:hypothetical protein [Spirosoma utsteinense]MBC3785963.1 hypothetical protein [Spirosoma utsteinense]MBC3790661.1 hypothetical protein [Spirosoma utsteinense]